MATLHVHTLTFRSGLHLGTRGLNLEEAAASVPSDTLYSALLHTWRTSGGDVEAFARPYVAGEPPFLLTSLFPYAGGVRFYPMPVDVARLVSAEAMRGRGKQVKRIAYISEALLRRALAGEKLDDALFADTHAEPSLATETGGAALQGGTLWLAADEVKLLPKTMRSGETPARAAVAALAHQAVWVTERVPRVTVTRTSAASNVFFAGRTRFAAGCGLWFGVQWRQPQARIDGGPSYRNAFDSMLALLGDAGLGGERSAGYGAFVQTFVDELELPDATAGRPALLLSRYHPRPQDAATTLGHESAAYALTSVGGWLHSPDAAAQRRKRIALVAEGSIVCPPSYPAGDVVDVRPSYAAAEGAPPHPVYRFGLALTTGMAA